MVRTKLAVVLGLLGFVALAAGGWALGSRRDAPAATPEQKQTAAWAAEVRTATAAGGQDRVVATVDSAPIYRSQVTGLLAAAHSGASSSDAATGDIPSTAEAALDQLVDNALVAAAARQAGIEVSEDEVSAAIQSGTVQPLRDGTLTSQQKEAAEAALALAGTDVDHVLEHEPTRAIVRDGLLRSRYLETTGFDRASIVEQARAAIPFEIVPGALDP